ncbi:MULTISPECIES: acyl-CoA dehydrogenase family protein [Streptomyces]|uniref:Acyl-CoA dehydrogenase C-terminal domain-containing protein n=1 Tax=Streptomyces eurythermus TaxID=42237 RepID=A0ABW6Z9A7_9ACTN|nr:MULTISPECIES: hypothetical protein [Streptomyces]QIS75111.1 hypothetical protein HB370_38390 [Streptomyces sp. DSM 40868]
MTTVAHTPPSGTRHTVADDIAGVCEAARTHRAYGEEHSTLHPQVWEALRSSPLPRAALPKHCGGLEWGAPHIVEAVRVVAAADPSAGWAAAIHAPAGAFLARLDPPLAKELCPPSETAVAAPVIGGSSVPAGTTAPAGDRMRLQGRWPLVTSAPQLTLAALAARTEEGTRWWLVPGTELRVEDDWDAVGLRGSASHSVSCDTLVPAGHSVCLTDPARIDGALYRFPLYGLMAACIAAVAEATAERALEAFAALAQTARPRHATGSLAHLPAAQEHYAAASARLSAASAFMREAAGQAWHDAVRGQVENAARARLRAAGAHLAATSAEVCQSVFEAAGAAGLYRSSPLEGCWRDAAVASRHALVAAHGRRLAGAQMLTGSAGGHL